MEALICPRCGAPIHSGVSACPYCQVGLVNVPGSGSGTSVPSGGIPRAPAREPVAPVPPGWVLHHDPWHGFTLSHPPGWEVANLRSQVEVRADPVGYMSATISPFSLPAPANARQVAQKFIALARSQIPTLQAWQQGSAAPDSNRITLKTRAMRFGQMLDGVYNILVEGQNCVISGYQAPTQLMAQTSDILAKILTTFRTAALMERMRVVEPREGAFSVPVPAGWNYFAGVDRNNIGGSGLTLFSTARDPQNRVGAFMPLKSWAYTHGMGGSGGAWSTMLTGGYPALNYLPAAQYCAKKWVPELGKTLRGLRVERIVDRPDWAELGQIELQQAGYPPGMFESTSALLETTYEENGVRLRQKARVSTMRQVGGMVWGMPTIWNAVNDVYYRAPDAEFATWEPILTGILGDLVVSPQWRQGEQRLAQNYIANAQQDIARRQQQISQTLSETSDFITNSYWNRQATYDRISEQRSNAMLGYQNMTDPGGDVYKIPSGFDQYWKDGLGNFYGGSWLTQPDLGWQPLEPTGI